MPCARSEHCALSNHRGADHCDHVHSRHQCGACLCETGKCRPDWTNTAGAHAWICMVLFAIPIIGMRSFGITAPTWLKVACGSGFLVSLLAIALTIVPIIKVESRLSFALKITVVVVIANTLGVLVFILGNKRT